MYSRIKGLTLFSLTILVSFLEVHAQTSDTTSLERPTVTRAFDLIEVFPDRVAVGTPAVFKLKVGNQIKQIVDAGLLVRIFSLGEGRERPHPFKTVDDCDIYLSVVHRLVRGTTNVLRLETIGMLDEAWLNLSYSLKSIQPGRYYLVFEKSDSNAMTSGQFRIKSSDATMYFDTGFRFSVEADPNLRADSLRKEYLKRERHLGQLKQEADDESQSVPCYRYRRLNVQTADEELVTQGMLQACSSVEVNDEMS